MERIALAHIREDLLHSRIYPRAPRTHFWSDSWDPRLYVSLARAGFISIASDEADLGVVLLPELEKTFAVLDWRNLHLSRNLRWLIASGRLAEEQVELRVAPDCSQVLERLVDYHRPRTWLLPPYCELVRELERSAYPHFAIHGIELWSNKAGRLIAGELGYTIGRSYTSLSGFCVRGEERWKHFGTLQMVLLAERLRNLGYVFWNMGYPWMDYKIALGARLVPRLEFLERWIAVRDADPLMVLGREPGRE